MSTNYALKFLHNKQLGLSRNLVEELISTDEFSKEMMPYVSSGTSITPDLVLEVVTDIYIKLLTHSFLSSKLRKACGTYL